jgi:Ca-activated chloride channel family protein
MIQHQEALNPSRLSSLSGLIRSIFVLLSLLTLLQAIASAQDNDSSDDVLRVRTDLVTVPAIVTDAHGRRVAGLKQSDFAVRDNGRDLPLSYFAAGTEYVALAFALDTSGSIRDLVEQQRDAALELFSRFGRGSRVAVLHFGERAALVVPFTTEGDKVLTAFDAHTQPGERTAIFDAVDVALQAFSMSGSSPTERRILILISDGLDNMSSVRAATVINHARSLGVSIYAIHLPLYAPRDGKLEPRPAARGFRDLAEKTGGRYFMAGDARSALDPHATIDLTPVFRAIEEDLQGQYVLGYYPDEAARQTPQHRIEINLIPQHGRKLRVQTLREEYNLKQ